MNPVAEDTRADRLYAALVPLIKESPGGVTRSEVRALMTAHGYSDGYSTESIIAHLPDGCPVWEETDDEREVWYHLLRPTDHEWVSKRSVPKMSQPKKTGEGERIRIDPEVVKQVKLFCLQNDLDLRKFVEVAIKEKMALGRK